MSYTKSVMNIKVINITVSNCWFFLPDVVLASLVADVEPLYLKPVTWTISHYNHDYI